VNQIDVSSFRASTIVEQTVFCPSNHRTTIKVKGGGIIDIKVQEIGETDVDDYVDVPAHIRDVVKEAHVCYAQGATKSGAMAVRLILDDLLFEKGFQEREPMQKVNAFEQRCRTDTGFEAANRSLFRRIDLFKTIAGLAGYHAHAQPQRSLFEVQPEEFHAYLMAVESAVKETWNRRL